MILVFLLHRGQEWWQPMSHDVGVHAWTASEVLGGKVLYRDLWSNKTPGLVAFYAGVLAVLPPTNGSIQLAYTLVTLVALLVFAILARGALGAGIAVWFATSMFLFHLTLPAWSEGGAMGEGFLIVPAMAAAACLLASEDRGRRWLVAAGALVGGAFWIKQPGASIGIAMILWVCWRSRHAGLAAVAGDLAALAGGLLLALIPGILLLHLQGSFEAALDQTIRFNLGHYREARAVRDLASLGNFVTELTPGAALLLAAVLGLGRRSPVRAPVQVFAVLWLGVDLAVIIAQHHFFPHHNLVLIPPASLLAGGGLAAALEGGSRGRRWLTLLVPGLMVPVLVGSVARARDIHHERFVEGWMDLSEITAGWLRENTAPGDPVLVWGTRPGVYFLAQRPSATSFYALYPLCIEADGPRRRFLMEMQATPPRVIIDTIPGDELDHAPYLPLLPEDEGRMPAGFEQSRGRLRPILDHLRARYRLAGRIDDWRLLTPRVPAPGSR